MNIRKLQCDHCSKECARIEPPWIQIGGYMMGCGPTVSHPPSFMVSIAEGASGGIRSDAFHFCNIKCFLDFLQSKVCNHGDNVGKTEEVV